MASGGVCLRGLPERAAVRVEHSRGSSTPVTIGKVSVDSRPVGVCLPIVCGVSARVVSETKHSPRP